jgi:hypothetical protein
MHRFIDGDDRMQLTLLPNSLEDYVSEENPVRVIEVFVDELDLAALGFAGMTPAATGRILQIFKLTDPEITMGKRNLTIPFLVNNADFAATPRDMAKLKKIAARIDKFRARIVPARNKLISHLDLDAALRRKSLGGASVAAWQKFWLDLQDLVAILYKRYVDARVPFYLNGVVMISDADQLLRAIKESTYFEALLHDRDLTRRVSDVGFSSKYYGA